MKRPLTDAGAAADQEAEPRPAPVARSANAVPGAFVRRGLEDLDKPALVELVMQLQGRYRGVRAGVLDFLAAAMRGVAPPPPDCEDLTASFEEDLNAAVEEAHEKARAKCGNKHHLIDEGSGTVKVVACFVAERIAAAEPGALQLEMLLAARKAITGFDLEGVRRA